MTPEQRRRVRDLFEGSMDRAPSRVAAWIAEQASDDPDVRAELLSLVDHHSRAGAFLEQPIVEQATELLADEEPITPGDQVGGYEIVRELGRGGMGRVYLATDPRLRRTVALKALAPNLTREPAQRERLRREARAAAALSHPGICTVYALDEVDGQLYIASEYVDGATLADEIRSGLRPSRDALTATARELAAALASAHAKAIVHRDLKPENVMRTHDGRLKILDFGLAQVRAAMADPPGITQPGMLIGTPAYMAPEQINGQPADQRSDVFALGVLLYEYASGAHPFASGSTLATVARVLDGQAPPIAGRADVSSGLAAVIARCLSKSPGDRFGSAAEIVAAIDAAPTDAPAAADRAVWWRIHQVVIVAIYTASVVLAWQIKEWIETPLAVAIFLALGALATAAGILRGHLVFTSAINRGRLTIERRRTRLAVTMLDGIIAILLVVDALLLARTRALPTLLALVLGVGIGLASLVLEPATTEAAFGDQT
jgi:serine/threonine-protein kinase